MSRSADDEHAEADPEWARARHQLFAMIMEGRSFSGRERNCLFLNTGKTRMATVSAISGIDFPDDGRGVAIADWDGDGDQDLWISNRNGPRLRFLRNETDAPDRAVVMKLQGNGTETNSDAIGSRVVLYYRQNDKAQPPIHKTLRAGEGFISQSSKNLHFGLGKSASIDKVVVHWAAGSKETFSGIQPGHRYLLKQGTGRALPLPNRHPVLLEGSSEDDNSIDLPAASRKSRVVLQTRMPMPRVEYSSLDGKNKTVSFSPNQPVIVNLWASYCEPCIGELSEFASSAEEFRQHGVDVLALSVDRVGDGERDTSAAIIEKLKFPFQWGYLNEQQLMKLQELAHQFSFLRRPLPLPSSFLVDRYGRVAVMYRGPVTTEQILHDVLMIDERDRASAELVACLPGSAIDHPVIESVARTTEKQTRFRMASWLENSGYLNDAVDQLSAAAQAIPDWLLPKQQLARLYYDADQLDYAEAWARAALKCDSVDAQSHNVLGLIRSRQGKLGEAERFFRVAIESDPQFSGAYNNLGIVLAIRGRLDEAQKCFARAVELDSRFAEAHLNLGNVFASQQKTEQAIRHYKQAIAIDPKYIEPYNNLGTLYGRLGQLEMAIRYYQKALELDPENENAQRNLNRALQSRRQLPN